MLLGTGAGVAALLAAGIIASSAASSAVGSPLLVDLQLLEQRRPAYGAPSVVGVLSPAFAPAQASYSTTLNVNGTYPPQNCSVFELTLNATTGPGASVAVPSATAPCNVTAVDALTWHLCNLTVRSSPQPAEIVVQVSASASATAQTVKIAASCVSQCADIRRPAADFCESMTSGGGGICCAEAFGAPECCPSFMAPSCCGTHEKCCTHYAGSGCCPKEEECCGSGGPGASSYTFCCAKGKKCCGQACCGQATCCDDDAVCCGSGGSFAWCCAQGLKCGAPASGDCH